MASNTPPTSPTAGSFVPMLSGEAAVATASTGAATLNSQLGIITSEALTTAQDAAYTLTLTNNFISLGSIVLVSVASGTNTQGTPVLVTAKPGAGSVAIVVKNKHASAEALNGTLKISYVVL